MANSGHPYLTGRDTDEIKNVQFGVNTFTGSGDAGRLAALDNDGRIPMSLLPTQVTSGTANNVGFTAQIPDNSSIDIPNRRIGIAYQGADTFSSTDDDRISITIISASSAENFSTGTLYYIYTEDGGRITGGSIVRAVSRGLVPHTTVGFSSIFVPPIYLITSTSAGAAGSPVQLRPTYLPGQVEVILGWPVTASMMDFNPQIIQQYT